MSARVASQLGARSSQSRSEMRFGRARIGFDCQTANGPAMMSSTSPARFTIHGAFVIQYPNADAIRTADIHSSSIADNRSPRPGDWRCSHQ
jgi:hypothetical protein